jgi:hypothetical protein
MLPLNDRTKQPREGRIAASAVRDWDGNLRLVHHATDRSYDLNDMAPFTHFGTRRAARDRAELQVAVEGSEGEFRTISAWLDIRNPLMIEDVPDEHNSLHLAESIREVRPEIIPDEDFNEMFEMEAGDSDEFLLEILQEAGIDGLCYRNDYEDPGSKSWIIFDASQVILQREGTLSGTKDPWELSEEEFIGPSFICESFAIHGEEEEYEHLWEDLRESGSDFPVMARQGDWSVRWLSSWEPEATLGLFRDRDDEPKGFYMGGQLWIDEDARGQQLSSMMINVAADILGRNPTQNTEGLGFSPAGYAAHASAWRIACENAAKIDNKRNPKEEDTCLLSMEL